jgi:polysaccharide deacetylase family protein (PEP-CTERM system associated)
MSVDLEDWFCVYNMRSAIPLDAWEKCESRVERNTMRLAELFGKHRVEVTFFVLGWVADRYPDLIRELEHRGHEVATHGYSHRLITEMTPQEFEDDLTRALEVTSRCVSEPILGFRAPSFSVTNKTMWAIERMRRLGIRYDSSVFPIGFHPDYGIGDAPLEAHSYPNGLLEIPMSCAELGGRRIPCSGGAYFRILPYALTRRLIERCNRQGRPVIFYLHPWEIDPEQPRMKLSWQKSFRHYFNLGETWARLDTLLGDFRFTSFRTAYGDQLAERKGG